MSFIATTLSSHVGLSSESTNLQKQYMLNLTMVLNTLSMGIPLKSPKTSDLAYSLSTPQASQIK